MTDPTDSAPPFCGVPPSRRQIFEGYDGNSFAISKKLYKLYQFFISIYW